MNVILGVFYMVLSLFILIMYDLDMITFDSYVAIMLFFTIIVLIDIAIERANKK